MSLDIKCHQKLNVTKQEMSPNMKCKKKEISQNIKCHLT